MKHAFLIIVLLALTACFTPRRGDVSPNLNKAIVLHIKVNAQTD